jgi:4-methylaminobutanoate oxidase (formaldehyde-forming)
MSNSTSDIIIIGGGIIGNAIAYYLSMKTHARIVVIEQNHLCSGSTSLAGSLITKLRGNTQLIPMVEETHRAVSFLKDFIPDSINENRVGCLHVAISNDSVKSLEQLKNIADDFNIDTEMVTSAWIRNHIPWLKTAEIQKALFAHDEFLVDGTQLGLVYAAAARKMGVKYFIHTEVTQLLAENGKVTGVNTSCGQFTAEVVIDAAGIWSNRLLSALNVLLPYAPVRSVYFITEPNPEKYPPNQPVCILPDASAFTRPWDGALLFGIRDKNSPATHPLRLHHDLHDQSFISPCEMWDILKNQAATLLSLMNESVDLKIARNVAAPCAYSYDGNPLIGKVAGFEGLFAATGCSGGGIAASAGFGRLMAELVLNEPTFVQPEPFNPALFPEADPYSDEFMEQCSRQRSGKKSG